MKLHRIAALALIVALSNVVVAEEKAPLSSGPQVGKKVPGPFHPLNVNGDNAGKKHCLFCEAGDNPVAMIFARETSPELTTLVKKLDAACVKEKDNSLCSFVVFCNDSEGLESKLKTMAKDADLKKVVLAIDNPAGPEKYSVSKDADVTVVLYVKREVKGNYAFKKGEMKDKDVSKIVESISSITK